jgi:4-amino-4-deoxy-L-arabinose transferase-like glycosyltransferase
MLEAMTDTRTAPSVGAIVRAERRVGRLVDSRWTVAVAAAAAFLLRLPGLTRPVRADEAGYQLVARAWLPMPDSVYGAYFVDRPPPMIALFKFSDAVGGPLFIRVLGAVACAALVLAAAAVARLVADEHAARWTAVAVAALSTNVLIDAVAVKGELLALPVLMSSLGLSLVAVRDRSWRVALAAGFLAGLALGFKQNLAGGVVFAAVLFVASWLAGRLTRPELVRLAGAASIGFAVPVLATIGWALAAGVRLHTLWYAVYGFRFDASRVLSDATDPAPTLRAGLLVLVALGAGMLLIIGGFVVHIRGEWADDAPLTAAVAAMLVVDVVGLVSGGSYWRDYLFPLIPGTALCAALLARRASRRGRAMRTVIIAATASTVLSLVGWVAYNAGGLQEYDEHDTGVALREVAEPGDTLVVYGGRADLQLDSGLSSPYAYLWSLPMRTLDPDLAELRALVGGDNPPTWIVEWVAFRHWDGRDGARLEQLVQERYVRAGTACGDRPIWLLRGVDRATPEPDCHGHGFEFSSGP